MTDFLMGRRQWDAHELIGGCKPRSAQNGSTVTASLATLDGCRDRYGMSGYSEGAMLHFEHLREFLGQKQALPWRLRARHT